MLGQGFSGSLFVVVGAVMSIAMQYVVGKTTEDPTIMLASLSLPILGLVSLLLVAFANIGTQAVGSYLYGVMLKSSFKKAKYSLIIMILALYVIVLCVWGKVVEYFGSFLTLSGAIYAPVAALLVVDFFFVRKQKLSLRSAFDLKGYCAYHYSNGINWIGFICVVLGIIISLTIYNPVTSQIHNRLFFYFTPTGFSFIFAGTLYFALSKIPCINKYLLQDRKEITI